MSTGELIEREANLAPDTADLELLARPLPDPGQVREALSVLRIKPHLANIADLLWELDNRAAAADRELRRLSDLLQADRDEAHTAEIELLSVQRDQLQSALDQSERDRRGQQEEDAAEFAKLQQRLNNTRSKANRFYSGWASAEIRNQHLTGEVLVLRQQLAQATQG